MKSYPYFLILFLLAVSHGACAHSSVPIETSPPVAAVSQEELSAGALLKKAFEHFRRDENKEAVFYFKTAIDTGNLNDAGRALAYWHIYIGEQSLNRLPEAADALSSFIIVAEDLLETRRISGDESSKSFSDRFDLERRLARARAFLSATWAESRSIFGRSEETAVPIKSDIEMQYFLEFAPPCAQAADRHIEHSQHKASDKKSVESATLSCFGTHGAIRYFFEKVADQ